MLGKFTREDETNARLDFAGRNGGLLGVSSELWKLGEEMLLPKMGHVLDASVATRSKMSLTNELRMAMALLEIPVSGWTCFNTMTRQQALGKTRWTRTLVDIRAVSLLAGLLALLLLAISRRRGLALARCLLGCLGAFSLCGRFASSRRGSLRGGRDRLPARLMVIADDSGNNQLTLGAIG